jgi:hypothetical protein
MNYFSGFLIILGQRSHQTMDKPVAVSDEILHKKKNEAFFRVPLDE